MFTKIDKEIETNDENVNILVPILSNMGYLMNNVNDKSFLDLLDKNIQYITSLLQMTLLVNSSVQKDCIEDSVLELLNKSASYFEDRTETNDLGILFKLSKIITYLSDFFEFSQKDKCFFNYFKGFEWRYNNQIVKPVEEIYKSYITIYDIYYCSNPNTNYLELHDRLNSNMKILFNLIDVEEKNLIEKGYER